MASRNCALKGNRARWLCGYNDCWGGFGGGAYGGTLYNCTLTGNTAVDSGGGGADGSILYNCTLTANSAGSGGGASGSSLYNCTLTGNSASYGGGTANASLYNCTLTGNSASSGGGANGGTLDNCTFIGNSATYSGGGAYASTLNNCTLTGNSAEYGGGAADPCTLNNCILYYNTARSGSGLNYDGCTLNYCCTTPLPTNGLGNINSEPQLASTSHLSAASPCIGAGSPDYATGTDIDGEAWANSPSIGCDEYRAGAVTGLLSVAVAADWTNVTVGFAVDFRALIEGRSSASAWDFGDGVVVSNQPYANHAWAVPGIYALVLRAWNESNPGGVSATVAVQVVVTPVHHVAAGSASPVWPYASWSTAARTIQEAVDAVTVPGSLVLVTNGVYASTSIRKTVTLTSVNGPAVTVIDGGGTNRCVLLDTNAVLGGFTLTNGYAYEGGGVWCQSVSAVVTNCILSGNSAQRFGGGAYGGTLNNCILTRNSAPDSDYGGGYGGGAAFGILNNCILTGNSAEGSGGGAADCTLNNCTLTGNSATNSGGGAHSATLNNCIAYYNTAPNTPNFFQAWWRSNPINYSCTTPLPTNGVGNISNAPLFLDLVGGNLRLQPNSPCINAGANGYVNSTTDLDGFPRIVGGTVDMGAYEFQTPASQISYAWLQQLGLPTDGSADFTDTDADRLNTWQEWQADTNPTNALSCLEVETITHGPPVSVTFQSSAARLYTLYTCTNLTGAVWSPVSGATDLPGTGAQQTLTDPAPGPNRFYRVGVRVP